MKRTIVYIIFTALCLLEMFPVDAAKDKKGTAQKAYSLQDRFIRSYQNNLSFIHLAESDSLSLYGDSLAAELDKAREYDKYFELEKAVIFASLLRGESRIAIARSDLVYSKAKALNHAYGIALSMNAIGEVYMSLNRLEDSRNALKNAFSLLKDPSPHKYYTKMLLVELIDVSLHLDDMEEAKKYLSQLNHWKGKDLLSVEQAVIYNYNAYYSLQAKDTEIARVNLDEAWKLKANLPYGVIQHLLVTESSYYESMGEYDKALEMFDLFFKVPNPERNRRLYIDVMSNRADLLVRMGNKTEAFKQYAAIYSYVNAILKVNYPKEIDQLSTRFQADQLTYRNEHARSLSIRWYAIGIVISVAVMLLLLLLGWRNIFKLRKSKRKQEEMKQKAESAIRKKNMFLSNMSHEVRTPLNAIVGFSTLLASDEDVDMDEASRKEASEIIRVNSHQLLKLINDILDLSDFEEDNIQFHFSEYDAVKICKEVVETIRASYKLQIELKFETTFSSLFLDTDDARLRQVLINLLVNAVKFTKNGSVILRLEKEGGDMVKFSVSDTGCGIPIEKQKLIFERFEKLNEFVQGTGLGLSICQLIVKYIGGRIWIDSSYIQGACFCFTHPLKFKSTLVYRRQ